MDNTTLTPQEVEKKGQEIYEQKLKDKLEKGSFGKYVAIDVDTEEYFIGESLEEALNKAKEKYPNKIFHSIKIGSTGVFTASGLLDRSGDNGWLF